MDPINSPTPNPNPETPTPEPAGPAPAAPVPPAPGPAAPTTPDLPEVPEGIEAAAAAELAGTPASEPAATPADPTFGPSEPSAIDPIMAPEPPKAPDPVEEELKAPMKAADPVPGSIGSSVSGPSGVSAEMPAENPFATTQAQPSAQTPNVSFSDPAAPSAPPLKGQKINKKTLIILIAIAAVVIIGLVVVLIISMNSGSGSTNSANNPTPSVTVEEEEDEDEEAALGENTLICTRNMTPEEVSKYSDAVSGTVSISSEFDDEDMLTNILLVESVVYGDEEAADDGPVEMANRKSTAERLNANSASTYFLKTTDSGVIDLDLVSIQENYEGLDFTCEML